MNIESENDLKKRLKNFRISIGKTQNDFAEKIGVSQSTLAWAEGNNPKRNVPDSILYGVLREYGYDLKKNKQIHTKKLCAGLKRKKDYSTALKKIGAKLRKIQIENNLDNEEMAKLGDMSEGRYEKVTDGKEMPYFNEVIAYAENFDISLDWWLLDEGIMAEPKEEKAPSMKLSEKELEILKVIKLAKENKII